MNYELHLGDNREVLRSMPSDSVDSIVSDPPYELGFMGRRWDSTGIAYDVTLWAECLRVLKPGGHLLAFGGSRTYHRLAVAIEDAGFEIRDCIMWLYGSGFPKSLAVDKAIDRQRDDREQVYQVTAWIRAMRDRVGLSNGDIDKAFGFNTVARHWTDVPPNGKQPAVPTLEQIPPLLTLLGMTLDDVPDDVRTLIWTLNGRKGQPGEAWFQREVITEKCTDMFGEYEVQDIRTAVNTKEARIGMPLQKNTKHQITITAPATLLAQQWQGWGTALKPAHEPIVVARKPLQGTVADNVTTWGVGGINVDGCRVGTEGGGTHCNNRDEYGRCKGHNNAGRSTSGETFHASESISHVGRWPANIILDEEAAQMLDEQSGWSVSSANVRHNIGTPSVARGKFNPSAFIGHSDSGGASRFFYVAKASKAEREAGLEGMEQRKAGAMTGAEYREDRPTNHPIRANHHPTVKPIALMRYLVRMVTPKGGIVLDPFMGSGTTGCAAMLEGMNFIGIDITPEYKEIAERRIQYWASQNPMGL